MLKLFKMWLKAGQLTTSELQLDVGTATLELERLKQLAKADRKALGRSLLIRHLDAGSNTAEEAELVALSSPYYDISRFGIDFTASPRHADVLAVTGPVTRQLKIAMERTYTAVPKPCLIVAIGDGACYGEPYGKSYACLGPVDQFLPVDVYIPGDPPSPAEILSGLLACKKLLGQEHLVPGTGAR